MGRARLSRHDCARQRSSDGLSAVGAFHICGKPVKRDLTIAAALLAATSAAPASAQTVSGCDVEQAQSRFAEQPRDDAAVERLLAGCDAAKGPDSRPALFRGVMARDRGDLQSARDQLASARRIDPANPAAALELALTEERMGSFAAADAAYRDVLSHDPRSRAAILGLARVARAQWRFGDAATHYQGLLAADPQDVDAINGMAWVALANHRVGDAVRGFQSVRQRFPDNAEAAAGLGATAGAWRLRADASIGRVDTDVGSAFTSTAELMVPLGAVDSLFVGGTYNSNQILAPTATDLSFLPKSEYLVGFQRNIPERYSWSVEFSYRRFQGFPDQSRLRVAGGVSISPDVQLFGSYRHGFGDRLVRDQLVSGGTVVQVGGGWEVVAAGHYSRYRREIAPGVVRSLSTGVTGGIDINKQGPGNAFLSFGASYNERVDNLDIHGRIVIPASQRFAFTLSADRISILDKNQVMAGLRFFLK